MFSLEYSKSILTAEQLASSLYYNYDIDKGFICGRMAYMSRYNEAIKFTSEEELVESLKHYVATYNILNFDYSSLHIYFKKSSTLYKITCTIPKNNGLDSRDLQRSLYMADSTALRVFKKLHRPN